MSLNGVIGAEEIDKRFGSGHQPRSPARDDQAEDRIQKRRLHVIDGASHAIRTEPVTQTKGRLSFREQEVVIPFCHSISAAAGESSSAAAVGWLNEAHSHGMDCGCTAEKEITSDAEDTTARTPNKNRKSLVQKALHSMIRGGSFRTDYTGQRSLSNTINISAHTKLDMSLFQTKRNGSWAARGVTVATDNLSYKVGGRINIYPLNSLFGCLRMSRMFSKANQGAEVNNEILKRFSPTTEFDRKELLKHITMTVLPGEIAFVMGPSGAGKSTLLDALAGRIKDGVMSGHIYFNGRPRSSDFYSNSAYVRQDDVHIPNLTVGETLFFAAQLRLGGEYTINERQSRIKAVSDLLGLNSCILSLVGDAGMRGISGGQLKRLSIAVEIMNMPSLIFLDEPTSGLDSVMAHDVMTFTNRLADQNRTILATIHQPSSETYALASKVILVSAGRIMFCGPANEAQSYFISLGFSAQMFGNPADFIIAVVSGAEPSSSSTTGTKDTDAKSLSDLYEASKYFQVPATRSQIHSGARNIGSQPHAFPTSVTSQTYTLVNRFWIAQSRQWEFVVAQLGKNVVVASICGAIFFGQGREKSLSTFSNVSFNVSSLWYFAMLYTVLSCLQIIPQLFFFGVLYNRERSANVYSTFAYWAANAIVCVPLLLLSHVIFVEISYWMVGLYPNAACHLFALLVTFLNNLISFYCAQCIAAISPSAEVALAMFPLVFLFLGSFAGFTIPLGELPPGWKWASYISYPRWTYQALIINEFQYRADRTAVLTFYSFTGFNKYLALPILAAFIVLMNVFVYIGLLPKQSRLQFENQTSPAESPKDDAVIVVKKPPVLLTSPKSLTLDDFKIRSAQRFPSTTGLSLMFRDLQYSVGKSPDRAARILKGVSGHVFPGQMCALMGGSGAGKSTLLDLLAHRKTGGFITGEYYIGGQAEKPSSKWCSYVTQDNVHISLFTVRETLEFAALLRLKEGIPVEKRRERAEDVMKMLGLEDVADVPVGNALVKGISGGQARRLSIGVEIMHLPDVLFLDEPTTGLDSQISHEVMSSVRNIANHNRTVVCTIHSPSKAVYELFDSLLLLALGRQTYFGSAEAAPTYFSLLTLGWCMPIGKNPADFLMEANQGLLVASDGTRRTIRELNHLFLNSRNCMDIDGQIEETLRIRLINRHRSKEQQWEKAVDLPRRIRTDSIFATLTKPETYPRSTVAQMYILTMRQFRKAWKMVRIEPIEGMQIHRHDMYYTLFRNLLVATFHGSLYTNLSSKAIQSRLSLLFFAIMFVMMASQAFIPGFFDDRLLFYRERGAGVYGITPYWFSSSLAYIPQCVVASVTYCTVVYFMSGLNNAAGAFGYFTLIVTICGLCGLYFCQLISLASMTTQVAVSIFPAALFLIVAFAGFVVRLPSLPSWLGSWVPIISFARWGFQGLVINEFENNGQISFKEIIPMDVPDPYRAFIENFGFEGYSKYDSLPVLMMCLAVLWLSTVIPIRFVSFERR